MTEPKSPARATVLRLHSQALPDEDVVAMCERVLADAKAGKFTAIAYVAIEQDGGTQQCWAGNEKITTLVGAAHELATTLTISSISAFGE